MHLINRYSLFLFLFVISTTLSLGQSYFVNGDAVSIGSDSYRLTTAANNKRGTVWYSDKIDLDKDFDLEFKMNFGSIDTLGADGMVFVLQNSGTSSLGGVGGGIGYSGFAPTFGVEFDTYKNSVLSDLNADHIGLFKNGANDHGGSGSLLGPIQASASSSNIEDGNDHLVRVTWDVSSKTLKVYFDCSLRLTLSNYNIKNEVFSGNNLVYWGFTSGTGAKVNVHTVQLKKDIIIQDTLVKCSNEEVELNARVSNNGAYTWTPNTDLNDSSIRRPQSSTSTSRMYTVKYNDLCGASVSDSVYVMVNPAPVDVIDSVIQNGICGDSLKISSTNNNGVGFNYYWEFANSVPSVIEGDNATGPHDVSFTVSGTHRAFLQVTDTATKCINVDSVGIVVNCITLPIDLLSFKAIQKGFYNQVEWVTVSETNNRYFELLKSLDGDSFYSIGLIYSKGEGGNSNKKQEYNFKDYAIKGAKTIYYKLVQQDFNGKRSEGKVIAVSQRVNFEFYPNPTNRYLFFISHKSVNKITVYSVKNQPIKTYTNLENKNSLDLDYLANGLYYLMIESKEGVEVVKISKK